MNNSRYCWCTSTTPQTMTHCRHTTPNAFVVYIVFLSSVPHSIIRQSILNRNQYTTIKWRGDISPNTGESRNVYGYGGHIHVTRMLGARYGRNLNAFVVCMVVSSAVLQCRLHAIVYNVGCMQSYNIYQSTTIKWWWGGISPKTGEQCRNVHGYGVGCRYVTRMINTGNGFGTIDINTQQSNGEDVSVQKQEYTTIKS